MKIQQKPRKYYCIRYSKAGIHQYADFVEVDGKIISKSFHPTWVNIEDTPSLEGIDSIKDILKVIKKFSYSNRAEIYLIDNHIPKYYYNSKVQEDTEKAVLKINKVIEDECTKFFQDHIVPILVKNEWYVSHSWCGKPVLICKDENNEWDNIDTCKDEELIDYMCYVFMKEAGIYSGKDINFRSEVGLTTYGFSYIMRYVTVEPEFFVKLENV